MDTPKQVNIRDFQHNLSMYLELVKTTPLEITKFGKPSALIVNPERFKVKILPMAQKQPKKNILQSEFIGMHEMREDWEGKTSSEISQNLRKTTWHGS